MSLKKQGFKTRSELANEYQITPITFDNKIQPLKMLLKRDKRKRTYSPKEAELIYEHLGTPK